VKKGLIVAAIQCAIVLSLAGKYAIERERLPHEWVKCAPFDPNLFIRGRYISLRLVIDPADPLFRGRPVRLNGPVAFFLPEHAEDPLIRLRDGEDMWVDVTVPPDSEPRPIRIGFKKDGAITPLP
jgi:hypothetical protein